MHYFPRPKFNMFCLFLIEGVPKFGSIDMMRFCWLGKVCSWWSWRFVSCPHPWNIASSWRATRRGGTSIEGEGMEDVSVADVASPSWMMPSLDLHNLAHSDSCIAVWIICEQGVLMLIMSVLVDLVGRIILNPFLLCPSNYLLKSKFHDSAGFLLHPNQKSWWMWGMQPQI